RGRRTCGGGERRIRSVGRAAGVGGRGAEVVEGVAGQAGDRAAADRNWHVPRPERHRRRRAAVAGRRPVLELGVGRGGDGVRGPVQRRAKCSDAAGGAGDGGGRWTCGGGERRV